MLGETKMLTLEAFTVENFICPLPMLSPKAAISTTISNSEIYDKNSQLINKISQQNVTSRHNLHDTQPQTRNLTTNNHTITQHEYIVETNFEMDVDKISTPRDSTTPTAPTTTTDSTSLTANSNKQQKTEN